MGIWDYLSCWNRFPKTSPELYETKDNIREENCEFDILVEKLIVIGVPYPVLCPGIDIDNRCCKKKQCRKQKNLKHNTQPTSFPTVAPVAINSYREMSKQKKKTESSDETTDDNEADEQPEDDNGTDNCHAKSIISRSSHRSELNDERSLRNDAIKINQTASGVGVIIPNPQNYEEKYYRDFILKYGTIFTENSKDPIPKDPNPVNPSNIVKIKPLVIPLHQPSTSHKKNSKTKNIKQVKIDSIMRVKDESEMKNSKQQDVSEIELSSIDAEEQSDESFISVIDRDIQTKKKIKPEIPISKLNPDQDQNFAIAQSSLSATTSSETQQIKNEGSREKIFLDSKQIEVESTSSDNHHGKKALRWKIIIRHQTPSTEQTEVMMDDVRSDQNTQDTTKISGSSSDSGYLHYDYVDD